MIDIGTEPFQDICVLPSCVVIEWVCRNYLDMLQPGPLLFRALKVQLLYAVVVSFLFGVSIVIICKDRCH